MRAAKPPPTGERIGGGLPEDGDIAIGRVAFEGLLVIFRAGQFGQRFVGGLLLVQDVFQKSNSFFMTQQTGPFNQATVGGDFVVLDFLAGRNQRRVDRRAAFKFGRDFVPFL